VPEGVSLESSGDVAIIRLDDGKANALSPSVLEALGAALDQAEEAGQALLLVGRPGRFSAGFDLSVMREGGRDAALALVTAGAHVALRLARFPAPVVIGCTGHALAMGAVLLLTADTRIGTAGDFKLGFNEVAIGMTTPDFLLGFARERISKRHFLRSTVQAEIYDPAAAVDAGFLDRVATGDVLEESLAEATRLAKLPRAAYAESRIAARRAALAEIESTI
jgi:enoyl-CoA hydratase